MIFNFGKITVKLILNFEKHRAKVLKLDNAVYLFIP